MYVVDSFHSTSGLGADRVAQNNSIYLLASTALIDAEAEIRHHRTSVLPIAIVDSPIRCFSVLTLWPVCEVRSPAELSKSHELQSDGISPPDITSIFHHVEDVGNRPGDEGEGTLSSPFPSLPRTDLVVKESKN